MDCRRRTGTMVTLRVLILDSAASAAEASMIEWLDAQCRPDEAAKALMMHGMHAVLSLPLGVETKERKSDTASETDAAAQAEREREAQAEREREREAERERDAIVAREVALRLADFERSMGIERASICARVRAAVAEQALGDATEIATLRAQLESHQREAVARERRDAAAREHASVAESEALRAEAEALREELAVLRRSNHGRGVQGEERVASCVRRAFPATEVRDVSKQGHACDLWWIVDSASGAFVAIEAKNKAVVTRADVDRFSVDAQALRDRHGSLFLGAIFVSCRSASIPDCGPLKLVLSPMPLLYLGFDADEDTPSRCGSDIPLFAEALQMFLSVSLAHRDACAQLDAKRDRDHADGEEARRALADVSQRMTPMLDRISRLRSIMHTMRNTHLASALALTNKADEELRGVFCEVTDACRTMGAYDIAASPPPKGLNNRDDSDANNSATHTCSLCGRVFRSAGGLASHSRACISRSTNAL